ncbi:MAG: hypothetical protein A2097_12415 [Desulfobacula sp. GWF2_41_7]|nr:MAG: hypothetical protein A2097_12415 [Desulfobacula sp. GWF2_41_7]
MISFYDHAANKTQTVSNMNLALTDVSLEKPMGIEFDAMVDGKPVSFEGSAGPLGKEPGKGIIALDLTVKALGQLTLDIAGNLTDPGAGPKFDLDIGLHPFSPRKLVAQLSPDFILETKDPGVLEHLALNFKLQGDPTAVTVKGGSMDLDDSKLTFSMGIKAFSKPDIKFDMVLNTIELDRYLPPAKEGDIAKTGEGDKAGAAAGTKPMDYTPLRKMVIDGKLGASKVKAHGALISDLVIRVIGRDGRFNIHPCTFNLYGGSAASRVLFDVAGNEPKTSIEMDAAGIQSGPLLKDLLNKDILEGMMTAKVAVTMTGDRPEAVKKTLTGNGEFLFQDGAIVGIDLAGMLRNVQESFGMAKKTSEKPRTDFAELVAPFTINNGLINTPGTRLASPLLRLSAEGNADVPKESLDFRVEPKIVATIKGQGDTEDHSGLTVPVLVTGTFSSPQFRPDLKALLKSQVPDEKALKEIIENKDIREEKLKTLENEAKSLFKGFSLDQKAE